MKKERFHRIGLVRSFVVGAPNLHFSLGCRLLSFLFLVMLIPKSMNAENSAFIELVLACILPLVLFLFYLFIYFYNT